MKDYSKEFIDKLIHKDKESFNKFYLDTVDIFFRYLRGNYFISEQDAQDLLSEFYFKVWNSIDGYKDFSNFKSWCRTILKNLVIDYIKKIKDVPFSKFDTDEQSFDDKIESDENIKDIFEKNFQYEKITKAIDGLDDIYKDIIYFKLVEEKNYKEISEILNLSQDNIRKRFERGIKKLREILVNN